MWLLTIEFILAIIAAIRGWGWKPFLLMIGVFCILSISNSSPSYLIIGAFLEWSLIIFLVVAAVIGKKEDHLIGEMEPKLKVKSKRRTNRIKCPQCAELVMKDAKICRFCGHKLS